MSQDQRFRKHERLGLRADFARVFADKCSAGDDVLVVHLTPNHLAWSRLGVSVSKRIGNAVRRNYVRRRIREAYRLSKAHLPSGYDIVCIAKRKAGDPRVDVAESLRTLTLSAVRRGHRRPRGLGSQTSQGGAADASGRHLP